MAEISICCANARGGVLDRCVVEITDINDARIYAKILAQSVFELAGPQHWTNCRFYVRNENDEDIFVMPFAWALGRRHRRARRLGTARGKFMAFHV